MLSVVRKLVKYTSSSKGAKVTLTIWLLAVVLLSVLAPGAADYKVNSTEGSMNEDTPSEIATHLKSTAFPSDNGLTALAVFHDNKGIKQGEIAEIEEFSKWMASDEKPTGISSALPFHQFPEQVQEKVLSEDGTTLLFHFILQDDMDIKESQSVLKDVSNKWKQLSTNELQFEITGPAGISTDSLSLFQNADFILMATTVILIFVILIIVYRSPLLAITPLLIAGVVYGVVDRVLGLLGKFDLFTIEGQAVSIMLVLLFAVVTDYSLFIFSRYREELHHYESKFGAMGEAIYHVCEPIFFSGGTVILAMLSLFATVFKPYHNFAPVFTVAIIFILLAGVTLIPALFALLGRKAFWPAIPKKGDKNQDKRRFWNWAGNFVTKYPKRIATLLLLFLFIGVVNVLPIQFSFNLLKSFPEDISSRAGFELLEEHYPVGELAPTTVLLQSTNTFDQDSLKQIQKFQHELENVDNINSVSSLITDEMAMNETELPDNFRSSDEQVVQFNITLDSNPYEGDALDTIQTLRANGDTLLQDSGFGDEVTLHFAGQTADQLDVKEMNKRDMIILFTLVTVLLTFVLGFQTKSVWMPIIMMGTIILSYAATLGFSWGIFHYLLNYDAISYRIPLYTFVFMVALGIDYNIILVSRIKEFAMNHPWKEAIRLGITHTGGVISSAGIILAATFAVLMTQPIQELFLFGFVMALGILLDTFLIRAFLLPSILLLIRRK